MPSSVRPHSETKFSGLDETRWVSRCFDILAFASLEDWNHQREKHTHTLSACRTNPSSYLICKLMHKQHTNDPPERFNQTMNERKVWFSPLKTQRLPFLYRWPCDRFLCAVRTHFIYNFVSAVKEMLFKNVSVFIARRCRLFNKIRRIRKSMVFRAISTMKQSAFGFLATYRPLS